MHNKTSLLKPVLGFSIWLSAGLPVAHAVDTPGSEIGMQLRSNTQAPYATDLVQDQPQNAVLDTLGYARQGLRWTWNVLYDNVFAWVIPSTSRLKKAVSKGDDKSDLFLLLEHAGYALQSIDNDVGIIPDTVFTFSQARELSEADYDYLDALVDDMYRENPGLSSKMKRAILNTIVAINLSSDYHVSSLELEVLPFPNVAFTVSPKVGALGRENSALMGALNRLDRRVLSSPKLR